VWGVLDGALQEKTTTCFGTNIGRSNERTPTQQAVFEAEAKHTSKMKEGYVLEPSGATQVRLPMKVKVLQDQLKNIAYPCVSTPKLNGVNATYRLKDGVLTLTSRGGEVYPDIPHLTSDILTIMAHTQTNELNGELYIHGEHLQDITSAVKKPKPLSKRLEFAMFDMPSEATYKDRRDTMIDEDTQFSYDYVSFLAGIQCDSIEDIEDHYAQCMDSKLEGTVVKNYKGLYVHGTRSSDQFKYKKALDAEFEVVGYEIDKNDCPVWVLTTNGHNFKAKPKGNRQDQQAIAKIAGEFVGLWATIEYEMLSKDGKPLKPIFMNFRDCDSSGNPLT